MCFMYVALLTESYVERYRFRKLLQLADKKLVLGDARNDNDNHDNHNDNDKELSTSMELLRHGLSLVQSTIIASGRWFRFCWSRRRWSIPLL